MTGSRAAVVQELLDGNLGRKPRSLLSGLGARISVASALPSRELGGEALATRVAPLDRLLFGGLPKGKLTELFGRRSSGRFAIGLAALASATSRGEAAAFVDLGGHLDPQGAEAAGVELGLLLWVRPARVREALAAAEMLLATGFPLVVADLGLSPGGRFVPDAAWVRLARAAQAQSACLLLLTPYRMSGTVPRAVVTCENARPLWRGSGGSPRLLAGISSRLTLQKLDRISGRRTETLLLSIAEVVGDRADGCEPRNSEASAPPLSPPTLEARNSA